MMLKLRFILLLALCTSALWAQNYEILFLNQKYEKIIEKSTPPKGDQDYYWQAQALKQQGKTLEAIELLENQDDTVLLSTNNQLLADLYYQSGQYHKAQGYFAVNCQNPLTFLKLMRIYEQQSNFIPAVDSIKNRLKTDSLNVELLSILANSYYRLDASVLATQTYKKIYAINPNDLSNANKLALMLINTRKEGKVRQAITIADKVLSNDTCNYRFIRIKGRCHYLLNDYHKAFPCFQKLVDAGYGNLSNYKHLGISEYKSGMYANANKHLYEALLLEPTDIQTQLFLGKSYLELDKIFAAMQCFENVDTLLLPPDETMITLLWEKQRCYRKLGSYNKVNTLLFQLLEYDDKPDYYFYIASNYENNLKDKVKAKEYYEKFISEANKDQYFEECTQLRKIAEEHLKHIKEEQFWEE